MRKKIDKPEKKIETPSSALRFTYAVNVEIILEFATKLSALRIRL